MATDIADLSLDVKKSAETYQIRPIVILISEEEGSPFDWFMRNQDKLFNIGYRTINIEQSCDASIEQLQQNEAGLIFLYKTFMSRTYKDEIALSEAYNLCKIRNYPHNMALYTLFKKLKSDKSYQRWNCNFIDVEFSQIVKAHQTLGIDSIKLQRDSKFANEISKTSDNVQGGTITILGSSHYTVYEILKCINPICARSALFLAMNKFTPLVYEKNAAGINVTAINEARKESYARHGKEDREKYEHYFPNGLFMAIDYSNEKHNIILDQVIIKKAMNTPSCTIGNVSTVNQSTVTAGHTVSTTIATAIVDQKSTAPITEVVVEPVRFSHANPVQSNSQSNSQSNTDSSDYVRVPPVLNSTIAKKKKKKK